ncbi:Eco57I restriction-modification methylase domain-containing protein [Novilysobacter spongiicola]|uniref:site-specific DNA-methyltransferase (adenine-specific) n=1 Tax=Lysobacter spongiicola DSM 21749 TaxID=1122188 RepID=A0A1T4RFQ7_9GAMM|nr:Methyltransferase domain-containing protein [Lysobacter spongiicola DSM 21749]
MAAKPVVPPVADPAVVLQAFKAIDRKRRKLWQGEEEVRVAWISALEQATGFDFEAERQRRDSSYNNVVIEFKGPGLFRGSDKSAKFTEATDKRLLPYIKSLAEQQGLPQADFIGIAIDGEHLCFTQVRDGTIHSGHLLPFSVESVGLVINACLDSTRPAVESSNLIRDFGHGSQVATGVMQVFSDALSAALNDPESSKIKMLYEEWKSLYGQVADLTADQKAAIDKVLNFAWIGPAKQSLSGRLFVIHSYNSLLIKLLAAEIVSAHNLTAEKAPAEAMCALLTPDQLLQKLETDIEGGRLFSGSNINGFVEEAIFSWYLEAGKDKRYQADLVQSLKALLGKLALYRTDHLDRQRDTLRDFYQDLVPETLRKSLGEFYTPDWLVDFTVDQVKDGPWLGKRYLDPTCGSGAFLIALLRHKKKEAKANGLGAEETIKALCSEVWGFDLNPLAVQTARVNFLMEIADLLKEAPGTTIEIPVLLADAIYSPAPDPVEGQKMVPYEIGSNQANLKIKLPAPLAFNRERLDAVLEAMGEQVELDQEFHTVQALLLTSDLVSEEEGKDWALPLHETYDQVLNLHRKNWNGIWFRIVRNFFWSATAGKFDAIVGNPPWVRWSSLPEAYRDRVKDVCNGYDIFSKTKHHGGNELDISAMITYTAGDKWLKEGGKLAFVITQSVFQNPSSSGFRNFRINDSGNLVPVSVDDMKALKPFPDAANKTAVAVFEKTTRPPKYPVPYRLWDAKEKQELDKHGRKKRESRSINPALSLEKVLSLTVRIAMDADPISGGGSPWAILPTGRFALLQPMAQVEETTWVEGRKGITVDLNGIYFVKVLDENKTDKLVQIESRSEAGRTDIGPARRAWIEPNWLHPLIKGAADFQPCYLQPADELFAIVPNKGIKKADFEKAAIEFQSLKNTRAYLNHFNKKGNELLERRSTYRGRMSSMGAPYYAIYNVGEFSFKPWKVIWAEMSGKFSAAVAGSANVPLIGKRPYVPDHKIFFVALDNKAEAHYLCGILNSTTVAEFVESHNVAIQVGNIFKHMRLPRFDQTDQDHLDLADKVEVAHKEADAIKRGVIVDEIRKMADALMETWLVGLRQPLAAKPKRLLKS